MRALPLLLAAAATFTLATPAPAQDAHAQDVHAGHDMGAMEHSGHPMRGMDQSDPHAGHAMPAPASHGDDADTPGDAPPPPVPTDHPADRFFDPARMAAARADLAREGRFFGNALIVDRLEYRTVRGRDGYGWQGEAWIGADLDKLVIASEGEGAFGEAAERVELRALWHHAIAPYFNMEAGVRHDFQPGPQRTYATFGIDGLAPYWFDVEAQLLVSDKGDVHARVEGSYDLRLTNRLILQPAVELDAAFQDVPELRTSAGFDRLEAGARLRYQITRRLAPYIGVHWERRLGETARLGALAGERASTVSLAIGVRSWF